MIQPKAVIFDMDGVLVDSYRAHFESWKVLAAETGCEYSLENFVAGFGRTSREVLAEQWPVEILKQYSIEELDRRKEEIFRGLIAANFPAMPGAAELFHSLHNAAWMLAVGSSGPPENVSQVLAGLGVQRFVNACVTGADVTRGKPDPQVFLKAADKLGIAPSRCIVIEDAPSGVAAAKAAGMKCVGLVSTGRTSAELRNANLVIGALSELDSAVLERLLSH